MASPQEAARELRAKFGSQHDICVCIVGGGLPDDSGATAQILQIFAAQVAEAVPQAMFLTGGLDGVQKTFAQSFGDPSRLKNLVHEGHESGYGVGEDVVAAANLEQRKAVYGEVGDVYVTFGGGGGVAQEAGAGFKRGATVIPLRRSGGASNGMFNFPADALLRPTFATEQEWALLEDPTGSPAACARALVSVVRQAVLLRAQGQVPAGGADWPGAAREPLLHGGPAANRFVECWRNPRFKTGALIVAVLAVFAILIAARSATNPKV